MIDETLYWTKIAAIGQVAGAVATFLAAFIALYLARSERLIRLRIRAKFGRVVDANGSTPVVLVEVENIGLRAARVTSLGWTTGLANRTRLAPRFLRLKSVHQVLEYDWYINRQLPWTLEPGEATSTAFRRDQFIDRMLEKGGVSLFRVLPWRSRATLFQHRVRIGVSTRRSAMIGKVDKAVTRALEDGFARNAVTFTGDADDAPITTQ